MAAAMGCGTSSLPASPMQREADGPEDPKASNVQVKTHHPVAGKQLQQDSEARDDISRSVQPHTDSISYLAQPSSLQTSCGSSFSRTALHQDKTKGKGYVHDQPCSLQCGTPEKA
jgi:hypothetical protein